MSDIPPPIQPEQPPIPGPPPQQYAEYHRAGETNRIPVGGSSEKLRSLMDGYYQLSWHFAGTVLYLILSLVVTLPFDAMWLFLALFLLSPVIAGFASYPINKRIAFGMGWADNAPIIASFAIGVNLFVAGVIGYVIYQLIIMGTIQSYGVKKTFWGVRKKAIKERIAELQAHGL